MTHRRRPLPYRVHVEVPVDSQIYLKFTFKSRNSPIEIELPKAPKNDNGRQCSRNCIPAGAELPYVDIDQIMIGYKLTELTQNKCSNIVYSYCNKLYSRAR